MDNRNNYLDEKLYIAPSIICFKKGHHIYIFYEDTLEEKEISEISKDDYIKIFRKTMMGWFFEPLEALINFKHLNFHFGFIALMSVIPYIEMKGQLLEGHSSNRQSKRIFVNTFKRIFKKVEIDRTIYISRKKTLRKNFESEGLSIESVDKKIIEEIYNKVRNGFYHNNMFKGYVRWSYRYKTAFEIEKLRSEDLLIKINPKILVNDLKKDFLQYIKKLKEYDEFYENFKNQFFEIHGKIRTCIGLANL